MVSTWQEQVDRVLEVVEGRLELGPVEAKGRRREHNRGAVRPDLAGNGVEPLAERLGLWACEHRFCEALDDLDRLKGLARGNEVGDDFGGVRAVAECDGRATVSVGAGRAVFSRKLCREEALEEVVKAVPVAVALEPGHKDPVLERRRHPGPIPCRCVHGNKELRVETFERRSVEEHVACLDGLRREDLVVKVVAHGCRRGMTVGRLPVPRLEENPGDPSLGVGSQPLGTAAVSAARVENLASLV